MSMNIEPENRYAVDLRGSAQKNRISLTDNLEYWMSGLPPKLRGYPIIRLAIPGSHNSMTYTIQRDDDVGPDVSNTVRILSRYFPKLTKPIIYNWSINQTINIRDQLDNGIRYLDLRVATKPSIDNRIYFLHGLYGDEISRPLQEIADWLSTHPQEIIILDFQHFYEFYESHHLSLIDHLKYLFRGKMCPVQNKMDHITLEWMNGGRYQVFIVYRNIIAQNFNVLWPTGLWPTPWPDTTSKHKLIRFLSDGLKNRQPNTGYVSQCVLTPDVTYILKHIFGNLQRDLSVACNRVSIPWIEQNSPGNGKLNIVISDEVSRDSYLFTRTVIQRNSELLP